jgi:hypothetical protein
VIEGDIKEGDVVVISNMGSIGTSGNVVGIASADGKPTTVSAA